MNQRQIIRQLARSNVRALERAWKRAYQEGYEAGVARAHGAGRRGRTIRGDATVDGLVRLIERHFGLDRYAFEVRVVHEGSGRRVAARDPIRKYRRQE
jgi:hypothetical protein